MVPKTERFELRVETDLLDRLDAWRTEQEDQPSRAEAIRRLVETGLASGGSRRTPHLSDGEKLIVAMLGDVSKHLKVKGETDVGFVQQVIYGGHYWALGWKMQGIFHGHVDSEARVRFVTDVLDMWWFLELAKESFSKSDKARVEKEAEPFGKHLRYLGFDGNNESEYLGIARFFTEEMGRFEHFKGRGSTNSHMPTIDTYRRMLDVFLPIRPKLVGRNLSADEVIAILQAMVHPSMRGAKT